MKEVVAIFRVEKWGKVKKGLEKAGFTSWTVQSVLGRGKQKGIRYLTLPGKESTAITYIPKKMLTLFVKEMDLKLLIASIVEHAWTGEIGDGKVFVLPCNEIVRIRTRETEKEALG